MSNPIRSKVIAHSPTHNVEFRDAINAPESFRKGHLQFVDKLVEFRKHFTAYMYDSGGGPVYFIQTQDERLSFTRLEFYSSLRDLRSAMHELKYGGGDPENGGAPFGYQRAPISKC